MSISQVFQDTKTLFGMLATPRARVTLETKMRIFACTLSSESDYLRPTSVYDTRGSGRKYRQPDIYNPRLVFYGINHIT